MKISENANLFSKKFILRRIEPMTGEVWSREITGKSSGADNQSLRDSYSALPRPTATEVSVSFSFIAKYPNRYNSKTNREG
jgi:hypothetical protein